jgi:phage protein D
MPRIRTVDRAGSTLEIQLGYKDEYGVRKGLLSSVHGISLKDNPDKARSIRTAYHYEEDGLFLT